MRARPQADGGLEDIRVRAVERTAARCCKGWSVGLVEADAPRLRQQACSISFAAPGLRRLGRLF